MGSIKIYRLNTGAVTTGSTKEDSFTAAADHTIKAVLVTPRGNSPLANVQLYVEVNGIPVFQPDVPADILDPLNPAWGDLEIPFKKGSKFLYKLTNNSGASENYDISVVLKSEAWPPAG